MNWLFHFGPLTLLIASVAAFFTIRTVMLLWSADQGRKQDLVRKRLPSLFDYQVTIIIPFVEPQKLDELMALLAAIQEQDYPMAKVTVHLGLNQATQAELTQEMVRPNVRIWNYPSAVGQYHQVLNWLIDRALAIGGTGLFVFLKSDDMIKADFIQNMVAKGFDSFAVQGYVANKHHPQSPLTKLEGLTRRLSNRVDNAGRYHMGLSCVLQDSGWAVKRELLEMLPFARGNDKDNLEYTVRLNLENYKVTWAPNVVVFGGETSNILEVATQAVASTLNRFRLFFQYAPHALVNVISRMNASYFDSLFLLMQPSMLTLGVMTLVMGALVQKGQLGVLHTPVNLWFALTGLTVLLSLVSLAVSRAKIPDYGSTLFWAPMLYLTQMVLAPIGLAQYLGSALQARQSLMEEMSPTYKTMRSTRFNEEFESLQAPQMQGGDDSIFAGSMSQDNLLLDDYLMSGGQSSLPASERNTATINKLTGYASEPARSVKTLGDVKPASTQPLSKSAATAETRARMLLPKEHIRIVPLSNGKNQVDCTLKTQTRFGEQQEELYRLILEYKTLSFSTEEYRILDQAYYELHSKLTGRGLTLVTCGSCGYFYNPTADVPGMVRTSGVCLFGKMGKEVHWQTDGVTVLSQSCQYHSDLDKREAVVKQWKQSLAGTDIHAGR